MFLFLWFICFFVHVHLFGLWVLEIYIQWKKCTSSLFVFQFFFSSFAFFFPWTTLHFLKCVIVCWIVQIKCLVFAQRAKDFETFFWFLQFGLVVSVFFFLVLLLFLYGFVLTLLVDVFLYYCFSLFTDYVLFVHQHLYSAVLDILCSLSYFWSLKIFYRPPQIFLKVMEYCSKTL